MICPGCQADNTDTARFCSNCAAPFSPGEAAQPSFTKTLETPVEELPSGTFFAGRYEIIDVLGKGGMGKVYSADDTEIKEKVALKLLKPEIASDESTIERFRNELKIARKVSHKNICRMHDIGREGEKYFISMEYVEGQDLKNHIRQKEQLPADEAVSIAQQICEGLAEAHRLGVIHRDLKPQNIMLDKKGEAKIMDFGIARSLKAPGVTATGVIIGTPDYLSPEQAEGEAADQRSDIYSLGVILYEMVTGSVPFKGDTAFSVALKHKSQLPLHPKKFNPDVSDDLARLILICLEKSRERRYQTASDLLADLKNVEEGFPLGTKIQPRKATFASSLVRKKLFVPSAVLVLVLASVLFWHFFVRDRIEQPAQFKQSIAILPFSDLTPEKDQEAQCESLAEVLIIRLSNIQGLFVPARYSSASFKDKNEDPSTIGKMLNVNTVLLGTLMKVGTQLRITAQIIKVADGSSIWGDIYDGQHEDIFGIQDKLIAAVVKELELDPSAEETEKLEKNYTDNAEAYDLYLQGRFFQNKWNPDSLLKAIPLYLEALEKDPDFVLPYIGLSFCYSLAYSEWNRLEREEAYEKATSNINKALELDNSIGEAYVVLSEIKINFEFDIEGREANLKRAYDLEPQNTFLRQAYHNYYYRMGRLDEAKREAEFLVQMDPLEPKHYWFLGRSHYLLRQHEEAIYFYRKGLEFDPDQIFIQTWGLFPLLALERYDEAESLVESLQWGYGRAMLNAARGNTESAQEFLNKVKGSKNYMAVFLKTIIYGAMNDTEGTLGSLETMTKISPQGIGFLAPMHFMDCVRDNPRFTELVDNARYLRDVPGKDN